MGLLRLECRVCGTIFESGVPLRREHLKGLKLRALEVCTGCGAVAEYSGEDYVDPPPATPGPRASNGQGDPARPA